MPVTQFNMKWVEQAGLVKFDFLGLKTLTVLQTAVALVKRRGIDIDLTAIPLDDTKTYDLLARARSGRRVPTGKRGHAARAARHAARPLRGHHRAGRALSPRSDGEHPDLLRAQARHGAAGLHPSQARADPEGDLRRHRLSGTGDAGRADPRRLYARRGRPAAPRHGQEDPQGDAGAARASSSPARSSAASSATRPTPSSICSSASPNTASTRATPRPTRWSPTRPPI